MSDESTRLGLPYLAESQRQKHVTLNEAFRKLDALVHLAVRDRGRTDPPTSPGEGDRHIVASGATGAWAGRDGDIAAFDDGMWTFLEPREGWTAWVSAEDQPVVRDGASWRSFSGFGGDELQNLLRLGVGTTADAGNPFAAKLNNALWAARTLAEGGDGDLRCKMSKEAEADTLSLLFQTSFSGRAEIGLLGDDDLGVKVSANGSAWLNALTINRATGLVTPLPGGIAGGGRLASEQVFGVAGPYTWTRPAGVRWALVTVVGGGGGGGGAATAATACSAAGGGGGGGAAQKLIDVSAIDWVSGAVGAGGAAGASTGANGGAGGATNFGTHCSASGGGGGIGGGAAGTAAGGSLGGAGGAGSGGDINMSGDVGQTGIRFSGTTGVSGGGAGSMLGGGAQGRQAAAAGLTSTSPGSGGGGALVENGSAAVAGGAGGAGLVSILEFE